MQLPSIFFTLFMFAISAERAEIVKKSNLILRGLLKV